MVFAFAGDSTMTSFLVSDTLLLFQIPLAQRSEPLDQVPRAHDTQENLFRDSRAPVANTHTPSTAEEEMASRARVW